MKRFLIGLLLVAGGPLFAPRLVLAQGIPIKSELVKNACGSCHRADSDQRLSRISYQRKTPEGWEETIKRMVRLYDVKLAASDAREIVQYLSDKQGLTASELAKVAYALEQREDPEQVPQEAVKNACTTCHSFAKIAAERRTKEEWFKLQNFLLAMFPTMVYQHRHIDWPVVADEALGYLAQQYPLETPEWKREKDQPPPGNASWVVVGSQPGKGDYAGRVMMQSAPDGTRQTQATLEFSDGTKSTRSGSGRWYGGYAWRGSAKGPDERRAREVFHLSADGKILRGRWFLADHPESSGDEVRYRQDSQTRVVAVFPKALKRGRTNIELKIYGANLPANPKSGDLGLGEGVRVESITEATADRIVARVGVSGDAKIGRREPRVGTASAAGLLAVCDTVSYIRVFPERGMARVGGLAWPKKFVQFEARAFSSGTDGVEGTEDDFEIGPVSAAWRTEELSNAQGDTDRQFVGNIDQGGLFTPAVEGPNPQRYRNADNVGDIWVEASYTPDGGGEALKARAYLLVSIPSFRRNLIP